MQTEQQHKPEFSPDYKINYGLDVKPHINDKLIEKIDDIDELHLLKSNVPRSHRNGYIPHESLELITTITNSCLRQYEKTKDLSIINQDKDRIGLGTLTEAAACTNTKLD